MPSKKYIIGLAMLVVLTTVFTVGTKKAFAICTYDDLGNVISCADAPTDTAQPTDTTGGNPGTASQGTVYDTCMTNGGDAATCGYNQCMADGGTVTSCGGYEPAGTASQGPVYDSCMTNGGDAATCGYNQCRADGGTPTSCGGYESPGTASQGPVYTACMNNGGNIATCGLQQCMSEPGGSLTSCGGYDPSAVAALPASATTPYAVCMAFNSPDRCVGFTGDPALVGGAAFSPVRTCGSPGLAVGAYCQNSNGQYGFQPAVGSVGTAVNPVSGAQINPQTGMAVPTAAVNGANNNLNGAGNNNLNGGNGVGAANGNPGTATLSNPLAVNSIGELVQNFAAIFSYIVVLFAVLALVWTGLQFITAQGKPEALKDLHKKLAYILIGVAIVIAARVMIIVVINTLSASGVVNSNVIQQAQTAAQGH